MADYFVELQQPLAILQSLLHQRKDQTFEVVIALGPSAWLGSRYRLPRTGQARAPAPNSGLPEAH